MTFYEFKNLNVGKLRHKRKKNRSNWNTDIFWFDLVDMLVKGRCKGKVVLLDTLKAWRGYRLSYVHS